MKVGQARRVLFIFPWAAFLVGPVALAACTSVASTPTSAAEFTSSVTATFALAPTSTSAATPTQTRTPVNLHPQVQVLASGLTAPDDLLLMPDGSILVSDVGDGTIGRYGLDGRLQVILSGLNEPEGMALAPDGSLVIAEQGANRLIRYDFGTQRLSPFLDLPNHTANAGVDNIAGDAKRLVVPDSPNGTVLEVAWDGSTVRELGSGLRRPTGAWLEADGNILLADEYGNAVVRLHPDGAMERLADLSVPDDVIEDASGNIFVITLGDNAIHMIPAGQSLDVVLLDGLGQPQGIIFDSGGNLVVTDPGHHELIRVLIH